MASNAYDRLAERFEDLDQLNRAHRLFTAGKPGRQWFTAPLNRAAVVLLTAHLEGFLEDLFQEVVSALCSSGVEVTRLPVKLRTAQVEDHLDRAISAESRLDRSERMRETFEAAAPLWTAGRVVQPDDMPSESILRAFQTPWMRNICWLYDFLDAKEEVKTISWQKASAPTVRKNIDALVAVRNEIAHGGVGVTVAKADVTRYRRYVAGLAKGLNDRMRVRVHAITGAYPWAEVEAD